jgi:hypothetical protein
MVGDTHHNDAGAGFPADLYPLWCRVWLRVQDHATHLASWLAQQPYAPAPVPATRDLSVADARADLDALLPRLDRPDPEIADLALALGCLHILERIQPKDARAFLVQPPEVDLPAGRFVLVPPVRLTTRAGDARDLFPLSAELGVKATLGLGYRWLGLPADTALDWRAIPDLDVLVGTSPLRIGLAPLASKIDMDFGADPRDARKPDGRVPLQCLCALERETRRATLESVLKAAWERHIHVLLLPELVVDEHLLQCCRDWLREHNERTPRLRLVVAGSRHCPADGAFANRCTVLGFRGNTLWEQDKRSHFFLRDPADLARISPAVKIELAFEPTALGASLVVAQTGLGRALTPICLDYIEGVLWDQLGADLYLVPAMTDGLRRFRKRADDLGGIHGAASFICNAQTTGKNRCHHYVPVKRGAPILRKVRNVPLFTVEVTLVV